MICRSCGNQLSEGMNFCSVCGAPVLHGEGTPLPPEETHPEAKGGGFKTAGDSEDGRYVTPNIVLGEDGVYRWMFELSLWRNPTILITLIKVFGLTIGILFLFGLIFAITSGDFLEQLLFHIRLLGIVFGIFLVLSVISYMIYAVAVGGKYIVYFEMSEEKIVHTQLPRQYNKIKRAAGVAIIAAFLAENLLLASNAFLVASRNSSVSEWNRVKSVKSVRRRQVIYVNELLNRNQIYAEEPDFDFVEGFIRSHCTGAKIR